MSPVWPWIVMLAGVNLVRLRGRGVWVALGALAVLAALRLLGAAGDVPWPRWGAGAVVAGGVVLTWHLWALGSRRGIATLGLVAFGLGATALGLLIPLTLPLSADAGLWAAALLLLAEPANRILRWSMGLVGKEPSQRREALGRGEAIGVLERWIALIMVVRGDYAALGFLMAAKALARHKRFEDEPEFAEYFLVGTLGSVLAAIAAAEGMRWLTAVP